MIDRIVDERFRTTFRDLVIEAGRLYDSFRELYNQYVDLVDRFNRQQNLQKFLREEGVQEDV